MAPAPGGLEDGFEVGVLDLPAELGHGFIVGRDEDGGVAGAARLFVDGDFVAGDAAGGGDDLAVGEALAVAEVVDAARGFGAVDRQEVRGGGSETCTYRGRGAVGPFVVGTEEGDDVAAAVGCLGRMGIRWFRTVVFAARFVAPAALK